MFASLFVLLPISFCLSFYLFAPAFCPVFLLFVLLCSGCFSLLSFLICVCVFFFPCGIYAKKGAIFLRPLLVCCGFVYMFSASLSVVSFVFENIHPAPQERCLLNFPPRVLRVSLIALVSPAIAIAFSE